MNVLNFWFGIMANVLCVTFSWLIAASVTFFCIPVGVTWQLQQLSHNGDLISDEPDLQDQGSPVSYIPLYFFNLTRLQSIGFSFVEQNSLSALTHEWSLVA
jgi:hypothetical protein